MRSSLIVGAFVALSIPGAAQAQRSVEHFIMNPVDQATVANLCSPGTMRTAADLECANAQQAGLWLRKAAAQRRAMVGATSAASVTNPAYYDNFPIARRMVLNECAMGGTVSAVRPTQAQCRAAAASNAAATR